MEQNKKYLVIDCPEQQGNYVYSARKLRKTFTDLFCGKKLDKFYVRLYAPLDCVIKGNNIDGTYCADLLFFIEDKVLQLLIPCEGIINYTIFDKNDVIVTELEFAPSDDDIWNGGFYYDMSSQFWRDYQVISKISVKATKECAFYAEGIDKDKIDLALSKGDAVKELKFLLNDSDELKIVGSYIEYYEVFYDKA